MRSLLWKELRESMPWGFLSTLVWSLALINAIHSADQSTSYNGSAMCYLLSPDLVFVTTWGPMLVGTILGLVKSMPELSQDRWAYLVHRPVPLRQIYWGKVIGGLLHYGLALGIPFAVLVAWIATPGHQAGPFHLLMALPSIIDIVVGAAFYSAALLVGFRPGRWWGTKALPLLAAAFLWNSCQNQGCWDLLLLTVFSGIALLLWTGRGFFLELERPAQRSVFPSFALCGVVLLALITLFEGLYDYASIALNTQHGASLWYAVDMQERLLKVQQRPSETELVLDLDGHPVPSPRAPLPWEQRDYLNPQTSLTVEGFSACGTLVRASMCADYFFLAYPYSRGRPLWYYDFLRKQCLGYDSETKQLIGMVAAGGFVTPDWNNQQPFVQGPENDQQIDMLQGSRTLWTLHHQVLGLDFKAHQIHEIAKVDSNKAQVFAFAQEEHGALKICVIAEGNHLSVYDWDKGFSFSTELSVEPQGPYEFNIYHNPVTGHYVVNRIPMYDGTWRWYQRDSYYDILGAQGALLSNVKVPPIIEPDQRSWPVYMATPLAPPILYPLHLFYLWCSEALHWDTSLQSRFSSTNLISMYQVRYLHFPDQLLYDFGGLLLSSMAAYAFFIRLSRRHGWSKAQIRIWRLWMVLGGIPALIAFLLLYKRPETLTCPGCKTLRKLKETECPACHQPWPQPTLDGTEIISPST